MTQMFSGFVVLFQSAQSKGQGDASIDVVGIHRERLPIALGSLGQAIASQMLVALLLAGDFVGRRCRACGEQRFEPGEHVRAKDVIYLSCGLRSNRLLSVLCFRIRRRFVRPAGWSCGLPLPPIAGGSVKRVADATTRDSLAPA